MSFSTKLVDYFASGKCIFAIADKAVAPIMYLKDNDAAIISTNTDEIYEQLKRLVDNESLIEEYSRKSFECGKRNHDKNNIDNRFIDTMINASNKGK